MLVYKLTSTMNCIDWWRFLPAVTLLMCFCTKEFSFGGRHWAFFFSLTLLFSSNALESPWNYEHFRWRMCHNACSGRRGWPNTATKTPDADWDSWTFQQLEPRIYHSSLCWKGSMENHHWILHNAFIREKNRHEGKGEVLPLEGYSDFK